MSKKVLVVDDSGFFREQLRRTLTAASYEVVCASGGEEGLQMVRSEKPDIALLDVEMPGMSGFDVCRELRASEGNILMPIIMLTSKDDLDDKLVGLELGADDYVTKPYNERELLSRIRNTLVRIERNRSASPLTGLPGNLEIQREIDSRIAKNKPYAVIYADLDNFKAYNDVYGFSKGDMIIKMTADMMTEQVRLYGNPDDFVGHIGGDDFVLITTPDKIDAICREIISNYDAFVPQLFTKEDLERGYIQTTSRRGDVEKFPLTSISLAAVTNERRSYESNLQLAAVAGEMKKKVKEQAGSSYLVDQRGGDPPKI